MPAGATTTADGIKTYGAYDYQAADVFFEEGGVPQGARVFIPEGLVAGINHDNRAAIQAAVNAAEAAGGGIVYIPPGTYGVGPDPDGNGSIEVKDNVFIKGAGMGQTILRVVDHCGDKITGIIRSPHGEETDNWGVSDITLDGNRANNDPDTEHVDGFYCGGTPGDTITCHDVTLLRVEVQNCSGYGFDPHERTERLLIDSCLAHHNAKDGFVADYIIDGEYRNNKAWANDRHGFNITTTTNDFLMHDNQAWDNGSTGVVVQRGSFDIPVPYNIVIRDNVFTNNGREGILVQMGENILIENNEVSGSGRSGVSLYGADHVTVRGNAVTNSSSAGPEEYPDVVIKNYDDTYGPSGDIFLSGWHLIENNHFVSTQTNYGIEERAGGSGNNDVGNNVYSGAIRGIFKIASGSTNLDYTGNDASERIEGNGSGNRLNGGRGDDVLKGHDGDDILIGGKGADQMSGGAGDDKYFVDNALDSVSEAAGQGSDIVYASVTYRLKAGVERLLLLGAASIGGQGSDEDNKIYGNAADNLLEGRGGDDYIYGNEGNDTLKGGDGNDRLIGGTGNDVMSGGLGDDRYSVDQAGDLLSEKPDEGYDTVYAWVSYKLKAGFEKLVLRGDGQIDAQGSTGSDHLIGNGAVNVLTGDDGDDRLEGRDGNDTLKGGIGDDVLAGGTGADAMSGGAGNDTYYVDNGGDDVSEKAGEGFDTVWSEISLTLKQEVEALRLTGAAVQGKGNGAANWVYGNDLRNVLLGEGGNDMLSAGGGADTLKGGLGADALHGGAAADIFVYDSSAETAGDVIYDFSAAEGDKIDLASIDASPAAGQQTFYFIGSHAFVGYGRELRCEQGGGMCQLQADFNGDRVADFTLEVRGVSMLAGSDLIL